MKCSDLYGTRTLTVDEVRNKVASALGVPWERRYSDEIGYYFEADADGENFALHTNYLDAGDEDEVREPEFADRVVLLYVSGTERGDEIRDALLTIEGVEHLRRDTRD